MHEELVDHVTKRLLETPRTEEPIPHIVVKDVFPDYFYELLEIYWPDYSLFDRKGDIRPDRFHMLEDDAKETWVQLVAKKIIPDVIVPQIMRIFKPEMDAQTKFIRESGKVNMRAPKPNLGRLMVREPGFQFLPHVDPLPYIGTMLLYIPYPEQVESCGTILYKVSGPLPVAFRSYKLFQDYGIKTQEVTKIPYTPNTLFAFPNNRTSCHGLQISESEKRIRRSYQAHISVKVNDEQFL